MTTPATTPPRRSAALLLVAVPALAMNALRGALIGLAELIPGISGGTVALITGVYERLIDSAAHAVAGLKRLILGPGRRAGAAAEFRRVDWWLIVPLVGGMAAMVLTLAGVVEGLVAGNAELARGLFFGLVAASVVVPLQIIPRGPATQARRIGGIAVFAAAAVVAFASIDAVGGAALLAEPPLWVVFAAAAIAVCALVVPGVSGSFFLLAVGLYSPTLLAVADRDLTYLAVFAAGALVGLVTIVRVMKRLLERHRRLTLIAMAGLMLGSLRALWPWQTMPGGDDHGVGALAAPTGAVAGPILLAVLGAAVVAGLLVAERVIQRRADAALHARGGAPVAVR